MWLLFFSWREPKKQRSETIQACGGTWSETGYRIWNMPWQENIAEEMKVKFRFGCMQGCWVQ